MKTSITFIYIIYINIFKPTARCQLFVLIMKNDPQSVVIMWIPFLLFFLPQQPMIASRSIHPFFFLFLHVPMNCLSTTGVNGAPRTQTQVFHLKKESEMSASILSIFPPFHPMVQSVIFSPVKPQTFAQKM